MIWISPRECLHYFANIKAQKKANIKYLSSRIIAEKSEILHPIGCFELNSGATWRGTGDIYICHDVSLSPSLLFDFILLVLQRLTTPRKHVPLPSTHWKKEDLPMRETMDVGCHIPRPRSWPTIWLVPSYCSSGR